MNQIIFFCATYLIFISIFYAIVYIFVKRDRKYFIRDVIFLLGTATLSWVVAHFLKNIVESPRPEVLYPIIKPDDIYSFPSGHASFMFALGFAMNYFSFRAGLVVVILATITGIARVLGGVHFTYDIMGGAVIAYLVSYVAIYFYKKFFGKK